MKKIKTTDINIGEHFGLTNKTISSYRKGDEKMKRRYDAFKDKFLKDKEKENNEHS